MRRLIGKDLGGLDRTDLLYLKENDPNGYQDALRAFINDTDILSDRQSVAATEEIFEDATDGERKAVQDILRSFGGRNLEYVDDRVVDLGALNAATLAKQAKGIYQAELGVHTPATEVGQYPMRALNVKDWRNDPRAIAYVDPASVPVGTVDEAILRAARMGEAASQGDRAGVRDAQVRYTFTDAEVDEFLRGAKISGSGFGSSIRKSGLGKSGDGPDRALEVIDPETGLRVVDLGGEGEKQFYADRIHGMTKDWLQGGATAFNDAGSDIAIPGNAHQMEHDYAFSTTNERGLAETPANRAGYLERYVNSEKSDIDPTTYYQIQRLHYLADKAGIDLTGVMKGDNAKEVLTDIMERDNPSVTQTGERLIKDRSDIVHPERVSMNRKLVDEAIKPQSRMAGEAMSSGRSPRSQDSDGENDDRALVINSGGGDVILDGGVLNRRRDRS